MSIALKRTLLRLVAPGGRLGRLVVLTYHRVLAQPDPLLPSEPDGQLFAAQMEALAAHCTVLPLEEAALRLREGTLPSAAVCITFDDGYRNNLEVATPILRRYGLPATIFVMQNAVETGIMWNDLVIEAVRQAPGTMDLSMVGLGVVTLPQARASFVLKVLEAFRYQSMQERWNNALDLYQRAANAPPPRLMLSEDDLRSLVSAGIDLGGHTVNHPILAKLSETDARREIIEGAQWLARVVGRPTTAFAYPNGRPGRDFHAGHVQIARDAGFRVAVSTEWNCAVRTSDPFALPRVSFCGTSPQQLIWRVAKSVLASYGSRRYAPGG